MLATRKDASADLNNQRSTTTIATHLLVTFALAVVVCCLFSATTLAQGSLPPGTVTNVGSGTCNTSDGWYSYTSPTGAVTPINCQIATVNCANTDPWGVTFGWLSPANVVPKVSLAKGTIVLFTGDGGTLRALPGNIGYVDTYFKAGYEIVEVAWNNDWEYSYTSFGPTKIASIQNAACRPATFLSYIYSTLFLPGPNGVHYLNSAAGYCSHGASAGSAQIAYSLAYYGAGSWLDNVELLAGPVFSDINQGCQVPGTPAPVVVCGQNNYNGGQYGCQLGSGGSTWLQSATYVGVNGHVGLWTNDHTCAGSATTSQTSSSNWLLQSIVDQSTGAIPTFTYSSTAMSAWLCRSVAPTDGNPNNSSPQGQIFYAQIGAANPPPHFDVYAVDNCTDAEGGPYRASQSAA